MNEFLLLFRGGTVQAAGAAGFSPEQIQAYMQEWHTWLGQLGQEGRLANPGASLSDEGKVVKSKTLLTDGPFAEGKELIGGFIVVKASDIAEAAEMGKNCPVLGLSGSVEVRPIAHM
jgi:hypothetical protein